MGVKRERVRKGRGKGGEREGGMRETEGKRILLKGE